jgi:transposase, IS30 family
MASWWACSSRIDKAGKSVAGTLVGCHGRYVMWLELRHGRTAERVREALTEQIRRLPEHLRCLRTWDQGEEVPPKGVA